eukprot:scaffold522_cov168-Amphora_coffeaeformis.AAC.14
MKRPLLLLLPLLAYSTTAFTPKTCTRGRSATAPSPSTVQVAQSSKPEVSADGANVAMEPIDDSLSYLLQKSSNMYVQFAKDNPFLNNVAIASTKTAAADLLAQTVIGGAPLTELDLQRSLLFFLFGGIYSGGFQYLYQVQIFKRLFDVDKFTEQSWVDKAKDKEGLQALGVQTALDLTVLTAVYLPAFYIFKASVFEGSVDPTVWFGAGWDTYVSNFMKDEFDLVRVWLPADLVCFSVALYLRLPVRHIVSFAWTAYLSFSRGGH